MDAAIRLPNTLLPVLYCLAVVAYAIDFFHEAPLAAKAARRLMDVTVGLHVFYLAMLTLHFGHVPLVTPSELATTVALAVAATYLWVERGSKVLKTGMFVVTFSLVLQTVSSAFFSSTRSFPEILKSPLFALHTVAAVVGYTAFAVSAVYGVLFFLLYHELKSSHFGLVYDRLPPLQTLAGMSLRAVWVGVVSLGVTMAFGAFWAWAKVPGFITDPKVLLTVLVWLIYVVTLWLHHGLRWSGRRTIGLSLLAFSLLVLFAIAAKLWLESFHVFA